MSFPSADAQQKLAASMPVPSRSGFDQDKVLSDFDGIQRSIVRILIPQQAGAPRHNGTGFLVAPNVVVTSYHVAGDREEIQIGLLPGSGTSLVTADVIGVSKEGDLALFRARSEIPAPPLRIARFLPGVGMRVAAIGFPGLVDRIMSPDTPALTEGSIVQIGNGGRTLLHHAMLRPGNSGGPLMLRTPCGSVVIGVNSHIWADSTSYGYAESYYAARAAVDLIDLAEKHGLDLWQVESGDFCHSAPDAGPEEGGGIMIPASQEHAPEQPLQLAALPPPPASADPTPPARPPARIRSAEMVDLLRRVEKDLVQGNVSAARLLLERVQRTGDPEAVLLLAKTYDPEVLARWGVKGMHGNPARARVLYERARRLGMVNGLPGRFGDAASLPQQQSPTPPRAAALSPPPRPVQPKLNSLDLARLVERAERDILLGNVSAARLLLERARQANNPNATLLLAKTYDPFELARWGVRGIVADPDRARALYEQALKLGVAQARNYLEALR